MQRHQTRTHTPKKKVRRLQSLLFVFRSDNIQQHVNVQFLFGVGAVRCKLRRLQSHVWRISQRTCFVYLHSLASRWRWLSHQHIQLANTSIAVGTSAAMRIQHLVMYLRVETTASDAISIHDTKRFMMWIRLGIIVYPNWALQGMMSRRNTINKHTRTRKQSS